MTNSADPDQLAFEEANWFQKPTDLDLHCLQRQGISRISMTRVNLKYLQVDFIPVASSKSHVMSLALGVARRLLDEWQTM